MGDKLCRVMDTRTCPIALVEGCGDGPCARFESDDETVWDQDKERFIEEHVERLRKHFSSNSESSNEVR